MTGGMWADILRWHDALKAHERTVVCSPDAEEAVREAVERTNVGGLFNVQTSDVVPNGTVVVVNEQAIEANTRMQLQDAPSGLRAASHWHADYRALVGDVWRGEFRGRHPMDDAQQPPTIAGENDL